MGVILKLAENKYVDWSSSVDAPVSSIMTKEECYRYVEELEKRQHQVYHQDDEKIKALKMQLVQESVKQRMDRVEKNGTSSLVPDDSMESTIAGNRAGPKEKNITKEEIIELYSYSPEKKGKFPFT